MQKSEFERLNQDIMTEIRRTYSDKTIDHAMNPRNAGEMDDADGYGSAIGHCGDSMEIWLRIRNERVVQAQFWTDGCAATIASGSAATEVIRNQQISCVQGIDQRVIFSALDGLPQDHQHCATLAANAVKHAVKDYISRKREPWKSIYMNK